MIRFLSAFITLSAVLLCYGDFALAQSAAAVPQPSFGEVFSRMIPMFVLVFMIYYFMIVKPQQLKAKAQADLTAGLKKGDQVVTSSGIFGKVSAIESDAISLEIATNIKIKVDPTHVIRKIENV